jgi:hypothetical protein
MMSHIISPHISDNIGTDHTRVTTNLVVTNHGILLASGALALRVGFGTLLLNLCISIRLEIHFPLYWKLV